MDIYGLALTTVGIKEKYSEQLSGILSYVEQLSEVNTDGVEPTAQVTGLENVFREDKNEDWQNDERRTALKEAPESAYPVLSLQDVHVINRIFSAESETGSRRAIWNTNLRIH